MLLCCEDFVYAFIGKFSVSKDLDGTAGFQVFNYCVPCFIKLYIQIYNALEFYFSQSIHISVCKIKALLV